MRVVSMVVQAGYTVCYEAQIFSPP